MRRSRERLGPLAAAALGLFLAASAAAQDVSPLTPMAGKDGARGEPTTMLITNKGSASVWVGTSGGEVVRVSLPRK